MNVTVATAVNERFPVTILQLLRILWAHRRAEAMVFAMTVMVAVVFSLLLPKQYTAAATMFVDVRSPDPIAGVVLPNIASSGFMATQIDIVRSERVAQVVANTLKLSERAFIKEKWLRSYNSDIELNDWIVEYLQKHLSVTPGQESSIIKIYFTGDTPAFAAEVANAFSQAYLKVALELKLEPARLYATWFEGQTRIVRERLQQAQDALSSYQQRAGILVNEDRADFEEAKLNKMVSQLTDLQGETTESGNKRNTPHAEAVEEVMKSEVANALKIDIARLDARLRETSEYLNPNHPRVIGLKQELAAIKAQLARQVELISGSIETRYQIGKQRENELDRNIMVQKARVLELNKQREELNVYKRDVESAQRAFEAVSQRAAQTRLESLSNQTNVVSLAAAKPPTKPSRPRLMFNTLIAIGIGSMLGIGLGLLLELSNQRVRSQDDLESLGVPLLATVQSSRQRPRPGMRTIRLPHRG